MIKSKVKIFTQYIDDESTSHSKNLENKINKWVDKEEVVIKDVKISQTSEYNIVACVIYISVPKRKVLTEKNGKK